MEWLIKNTSDLGWFELKTWKSVNNYDTIFGHRVSSVDCKLPEDLYDGISISLSIFVTINDCYIKLPCTKTKQKTGTSIG